MQETLLGNILSILGTSKDPSARGEYHAAMAGDDFGKCVRIPVPAPLSHKVLICQSLHTIVTWSYDVAAGHSVSFCLKSFTFV